MPPHQPRDFVIVVYDGARMLDVVGATEMLLDDIGLEVRRSVSIVSVSGNDVVSSIGFAIPVTRSAARVGHVDTVIVVGSTLLPRYPAHRAVVASVRQLSAKARRTAAIGTGSFVLAAAGLLDGRRATTDRRFVSELAGRYPRVTVTPTQAVLADGPVYTSAGPNAGVEVVRALLRDDGMMRYSQLGPAVAAVASDPTSRHTVQSLAETARVSSRTLSRLFHREFGTTPAKYVELARLGVAMRLLDAGHSVTRAAQHSGFGSPENLRRAFIAHLDESPSAYRKRSSRPASGHSG